jgi:hypothetical protein
MSAFSVALYVSAGHGEHSRSWVLVAEIETYSPATHTVQSSQLVTFDASLNVPSGQGRQSSGSVYRWMNWPGAQSLRDPADVNAPSSPPTPSDGGSLAAPMPASQSLGHGSESMLAWSKHDVAANPTSANRPVRPTSRQLDRSVLGKRKRLAAITFGSNRR